MGFWIDYGKDDDLLTAETIDALKGMRKYQRAIIQGIQLIASLWEGRVDVLLTMFPWVADTITAQSTATPPDTSNLERKIERLEKIILEQGMLAPPPKDYPQSKQLGKGIGSKTIALPVFDDDDDQDTVVLTKATGKSNSDNFLAAMLKVGF